MFGEKKGKRWRKKRRKDSSSSKSAAVSWIQSRRPGPFLAFSRVPGAKEGKLGNLLFFPVLPSSSSSLRKGRRLRKSGGGVLPGIGVGAGFDNFCFFYFQKGASKVARFFRDFKIFRRVNLSNSVPRVRTLGKGEGGWGRGGRVSGDDCRIRRLSLSPQRAAALNVRFLFICRK